MDEEVSEKLVKLCNLVLILVFCTLLLLTLGKYLVPSSAIC